MSAEKESMKESATRYKVQNLDKYRTSVPSGSWGKSEKDARCFFLSFFSFTFWVIIYLVQLCIWVSTSRSNSTRAGAQKHGNPKRGGAKKGKIKREFGDLLVL